ncbi:Flp pilus assembly complex ATPase component TadA [Candidatus Falkowbacteria bacterium]|nr:Flp pilus assembly complex ATPase component TadA [Candidatus Falkowbacteria bacterium]
MPSIEDLLKKEKSEEEAPSAKLKSTLSDIEIKRKEKEARAQAGILGFPYIDLSKFPIVQDAIALVPKSEAEKLHAVCFFLQKKQARLAAINPEDKEVENLKKKIEADNGYQVKIYKISSFSFSKALKFYDTLPKIKKPKSGVEITEKALENFKSQIKELKDIQNLIKKVSVTDFVTFIIAGGINFNASDIHVEAEEKNIKIRYRIDGVLNDLGSIQKDFWLKALSRIKLLAGLKLNVQTKPQDGRFTIFLKNEKIDVRVSTLSAAFGEGVVMRLLMSSAIGLKFKDLGLRPEDLKILKTQIKKTTGMILTTGPTGSGKTTTLYAVLNQLNTPDKKIITLEDPIEYELEGINQSQVVPEKGYTFASGLRSVLRQDPDIVMVGEIRDKETAGTAIDAALTGHLVLSTLHTNNAPAAIPRLLSLDAKPNLLGSALNLIIAQRLVRRLCPDCKQEAKLDAKTGAKVNKLLSSIPQINLNTAKFYTAKGCPKCSGFGYLGRIAIFEILLIDKEILDILPKQNLTEKEVLDIALKKGFITMAQEGLLKAADGVTSTEEVFRVTS